MKQKDGAPEQPVNKTHTHTKKENSFYLTLQTLTDESLDACVGGFHWSLSLLLGTPLSTAHKHIML